MIINKLNKNTTFHFVSATFWDFRPKYGAPIYDTGIFGEIIIRAVSQWSEVWVFDKTFGRKHFPFSPVKKGKKVPYCVYDSLTVITSQLDFLHLLWKSRKRITSPSCETTQDVKCSIFSWYLIFFFCFAFQI